MEVLILNGTSLNSLNEFIVVYDGSHSWRFQVQLIIMFEGGGHI